MSRMYFHMVRGLRGRKCEAQALQNGAGFFLQVINVRLIACNLLSSYVDASDALSESGGQVRRFRVGGFKSSSFLHVSPLAAFSFPCSPFWACQVVRSWARRFFLHSEMFFNRRRNSASETAAFAGLFVVAASGTTSYFFMFTLRADYHPERDFTSRNLVTSCVAF
jgi:hypothetical protein